MRIPFEGILASLALDDTPLLVSVWGNDFTLHASRRRVLAFLTRRVMRRTDALHCDCQRDFALAQSWGFAPSKPARVLPGSGGVKMSIFHLGPGSESLRKSLDIPPNAQVVINPRGLRGYIDTGAFLKSIPIALRHCPNTVFVCTGMRDEPSPERWVRKLGIRDAVRLLPVLPHDQMADLFRLADVMVSPSLHDGTPNTLLESMACGCFPVVGNITSVREWIVDGENGLLCDPVNPTALAEAIVRALQDSRLRHKASQLNAATVSERASYDRVMPEVKNLYDMVAQRNNRTDRG